MTKIAYIIRGLPGSGKTTLANELTKHNVAADNWFDIHNKGVFDAKYLKDAHQFCEDEFTIYCNEQLPVVAVHNTFVKTWQYQKYVDIAKERGYQVFVITVHNHHGSQSIHGVPKNKIDEMKSNFQMNL